MIPLHLRGFITSGARHVAALVTVLILWQLPSQFNTCTICQHIHFLQNSNVTQPVFHLNRVAARSLTLAEMHSQATRY
ncbi:hypothetical protein C8Q76DRAFT_738263 [Earliella scabrosa]|nr:hypothetical protein C8Q76DRAFT_738263 [Earliella scabrosa]